MRDLGATHAVAPRPAGRRLRDRPTRRRRIVARLVVDRRSFWPASYFSGDLRMPNPILKQAVVIGAGMGGLAAAKALAPHFEKVIVLERDSLPDAPAPRLGTPQARHTHGLLRAAAARSSICFPASTSISSRPAPFGCAFGATCASRFRVSILFHSATSDSINSLCHAPRWSASAVVGSNGSRISSSDRARA